MQALSTVKLAELAIAQPSTDSVSLTTPSGPRLSDDSLVTLARLMAETQARYSSQVLPEGTPDMFLAEWEELTMRHGLEMFRDALALAIRGSDFFPSPHAIRVHCDALAKSKRERSQVVSYIEAIDAAKVKWLRDWHEDVRDGVARKPLSPQLERLARQLGLADPTERTDDARAAA